MIRIIHYYTIDCSRLNYSKKHESLLAIVFENLSRKKYLCQKDTSCKI